jgi:hypothetical protein
VRSSQQPSAAHLPVPVAVPSVEMRRYKPLNPVAEKNLTLPKS